MTTGLAVSIKKELNGFSLAMEFTAHREILVLFGPSGAGKTQTLNAIAGLNRPDEGEITLEGRTFFRHRAAMPSIDLPTRKRRIGYVFQHYALFPHLNALENVGFSFWRDADARPRARRWLERMRLEELADRYPHEVSGGEQQRIAIARALAAEPEVLLLDEPFSALDYPLRQQLHEELLRLQDESPLIVVYVTHNLEEALAMGQRLAVVSDGTITQIGRAADVVTNPSSRLVAEILGLPNLFEARVDHSDSESLVMEWNGLSLRAELSAVALGDRVSAHLVPDGFRIVGRDGADAGTQFDNRFHGVIRRNQVGIRGSQLRVALDNGAEVEMSMPISAAADDRLTPGQSIELALPRNCVRLLQAKNHAC